MFGVKQKAAYEMLRSLVGSEMCIRDRNGMLLLIDSDRDPSTGWHGYDLLINQRVVDSKKTSVMRWDGGKWAETATVPYRYSGKRLELAIPRSVLGLESGGFTFDFHWADNPQDLKDPISLCTDGDSAPNRRFNYRCIWKGRE